MADICLDGDDLEEDVEYILENLDEEPYTVASFPQDKGQEYRRKLEDSLDKDLPESYLVEYMTEDRVSIGRSASRLRRAWDSVVKA